jgi:hypothetical protein
MQRVKWAFVLFALTTTGVWAQQAAAPAQPGPTIEKAPLIVPFNPVNTSDKTPLSALARREETGSLPGRAGGCRGRSSGRPARNSSAWLPRSTMRPCSTTRIWSARRMVEKPVGDDEGRAPLHQLAQPGLDHGLGLGIERTGGLVEDEDARLRQQGAGNGKPLALPA